VGWTTDYWRVLALLYASDKIAVVLVVHWLVGRTEFDLNVSEQAMFLLAWMSEPVVPVMHAAWTGASTLLDALVAVLALAGA